MNNKQVLRSAAWFGTTDKNGFMYRSWMKNQGIQIMSFKASPLLEFVIHGLNSPHVMRIFEKLPNM